jgi:hypothetical protein
MTEAIRVEDGLLADWQTVRIDRETYIQLREWANIYGRSVPVTIKVLVKQTRGEPVVGPLPPRPQQEVPRG